MKLNLILLAVCLLIVSYLFIDKTNEDQTNLSTYIGYEVTIDREIHLHSGESLYYIDFNTESRTCSAVVGKEFERYYYVNLPKCQILL